MEINPDILFKRARHHGTRGQVFLCLIPRSHLPVYIEPSRKRQVSIGRRYFVTVTESNCQLRGLYGVDLKVEYLPRDSHVPLRIAKISLKKKIRTALCGQHNAVVTPLRKTASFEQRTNLGSSQ